jgi:hypothetical protein
MNGEPDVAKARKLINQTLDAMPDADILKLAQQLQSAAASVLLGRGAGSTLEASAK